MTGPLNGAGIRDQILKHGKSATEATAYFWGNLTQSVQDATKAGSTIDSGRRVGIVTFKASTDFGRGDTLCGTLCCVSIGCEAASTVLVWIPIPGKIIAVSSLKAVSVGCLKFRDMCALDNSSPLC